MRIGAVAFSAADSARVRPRRSSRTPRPTRIAANSTLGPASLPRAPSAAACACDLPHALVGAVRHVDGSIRGDGDADGVTEPGYRGGPSANPDAFPLARVVTTPSGVILRMLSLP